MEQLNDHELAAGAEGRAARRTHAEYYLQLVERANQELVGPEHVPWLDRLEREQDNLRAALAWTVDQGPAESAQRFATGLHPLWRERGDRSEGRRWLDAALALGPTPPGVRARALSLASHLAFEQGDYTPARAYSEEALRLAREANDRHETIRILRRLGTLANYRDDLTTSNALLKESLALAQEAGDLGAISYAYQGLGNLASRRGDYQEARGYYEQGLEACQGLNDPVYIASALLNVGMAKLSLGELAAGRATLQESLLLFQEGKNKQGSAFALDELARGAYLAGDYADATHYYAEALPLLFELGDKSTIVVELAGLAGVAAATGRYLRAALFCGMVTALCATYSISLPPHHRTPYEQADAQARSFLGEEQFAAMQAEGKVVSLKQAIAYALGSED